MQQSQVFSGHHITSSVWHNEVGVDNEQLLAGYGFDVYCTCRCNCVHVEHEFAGTLKRTCTLYIMCILDCLYDVLYSSGDQNGQIHLWIVSRKQEEYSSSLESQPSVTGLVVTEHAQLSFPQLNGSSVVSLKFSEEQALLLSGHSNGYVCVWDIQVGHSYSCTCTIHVHVYMYVS